MSINHSCETGGCYVKKLTPDWGFLDSALSGKIRVTDIDGAVEANGHLLILEWKSTHATLTLGQQIMFKNITKNSRITVFVLYGDPELSIAKRITLFIDGEERPSQECSNEELKKWVTHWETKVRK